MHVNRAALLAPTQRQASADDLWDRSEVSRARQTSSREPKLRAGRFSLLTQPPQESHAVPAASLAGLLCVHHPVYNLHLAEENVPAKLRQCGLCTPYHSAPATKTLHG